MFNKKYKKALKILNEELETCRHLINLSINRDFSHVKDPEILNYLILENSRLMDSRLDKLEILIRLKNRFKSEIGE